MHAKFTFLGTGSSTGIPMIGCSCSVCMSNSAYNKRLRPSGLLEVEGKKLLIDVGPDFRDQALRSQIFHLDGILLSHTHYDHVAGLDELRAYYVLHHLTLPVLVSSSTLIELQHRYYYLFKERGLGVNLTAQLRFQILEKEAGEVEFCGLAFTYITYEQGGVPVNGYRLGNFAYVSDIKSYKEDIFGYLEGVETLVISALSEKPSKMHLTIEESIAFARRVGAKRVYFTHICHEVDHEEVQKRLPPGFFLAYDMQEIVL